MSRRRSARARPSAPFSASELCASVPSASALRRRLGWSAPRRTGLKSVSKKRGMWMNETQHGAAWRSARRSLTMCRIAVLRCGGVSVDTGGRSGGASAPA